MWIIIVLATNGGRNDAHSEATVAVATDRPATGYEHDQEESLSPVHIVQIVGNY